MYMAIWASVKVTTRTGILECVVDISCWLLVGRKQAASQLYNDWSSPVRRQSSAWEDVNSGWSEHHRGSCAVPWHREVAWCHTGLWTGTSLEFCAAATTTFMHCVTSALCWHSTLPPRWSHTVLYDCSWTTPMHYGTARLQPTWISCKWHITHWPGWYVKRHVLSAPRSHAVNCTGCQSANE